MRAKVEQFRYSLPPYATMASKQSWARFWLTLALSFLVFLAPFWFFAAWIVVAQIGSEKVGFELCHDMIAEHIGVGFDVVVDSLFLLLCLAFFTVFTFSSFSFFSFSSNFFIFF